MRCSRIDECFRSCVAWRPPGSPPLYAVSPYRKDLTYLPPTGVYRFRECGDIGWWLSQGYAFVHADVRGSGHSPDQVLYEHLPVPAS